MTTQDWPNDVVPPIPFFTIATLENSDPIVQYMVTRIVRYNPPPAGRFACVMTLTGGASQQKVFNVWKNEVGNWLCNEYMPTRYRDKDGVEKGL